MGMPARAAEQPRHSEPHPAGTVLERFRSQQEICTHSDLLGLGSLFLECAPPPAPPWRDALDEDGFAGGTESQAGNSCSEVCVCTRRRFDEASTWRLVGRRESAGGLTSRAVCYDPPNEHTSEGGRDDRGVPYHAESTLSSAQVLKLNSAPNLRGRIGD